MSFLAAPTVWELDLIVRIEPDPAAHGRHRPGSRTVHATRDARQPRHCFLAVHRGRGASGEEGECSSRGRAVCLLAGATTWPARLPVSRPDGRAGTDRGGNLRSDLIGGGTRAMSGEYTFSRGPLAVSAPRADCASRRPAFVTRWSADGGNSSNTALRFVWGLVQGDVAAWLDRPLGDVAGRSRQDKGSRR